jgi:hypothetical protein
MIATTEIITAISSRFNFLKLDEVNLRSSVPGTQC